jgi:SpoVK/Ycf46/Vps4 family AAA+-type ATPase
MKSLRPYLALRPGTIREARHEDNIGMPMTGELRDLSLLLDSKVPILIIESHEEPRVLEMITRLAVKKNMGLYTWSVTEGLNLLGFGNEVADDEASRSPETVLRMIKSAKTPAIYALCDFHPYLKDDPTTIRLLREIAMQHQKLGHTVILLSHQLRLPAELKRYSARFELSMPTEEQLMAIVKEEANLWSQNNQGTPVKSDSKTFKKLVNNLKGMPLQDARQLVRGVIYDDGAIRDHDLPEVNKAKFALMDMEGVLSFEYDTAKFTEVGGLDGLKRWLKDRQQAFIELSHSISDSPKGIMLLGVQGSGKSLAAKAVAGMWGIPLLRLDFGSLYNKFFGETERNLRDALKLADTMSPCVLWLDEIEKGISVTDGDKGISGRLLATLLTWMAERTSKVFLVATSNNIAELPPELVRKGRLDEIFFVDLPDAETRAQIFDIHVSKRDENVPDLETSKLANLTDGFSGAEIEQVVVGALYTSAARDEPLSMSHLVDEVQNTNPLSVVMAEKIFQLRAWAEGRTVNAN